jgi:acyl carrier protein
MSEAEDELLEFVRSISRRGMARRITADTSLFESRALDSMNVLKLVGYLERRLRRRLTDAEIVMSHFRSVRVMAAKFLESDPGRRSTAAR